MRAALVVMLLGGCNAAWGIHKTSEIDAAPVIITIDAPDTRMLSIEATAPAAVYVGDTLTMQATVHGPPDLSVSFTASATAGSIAPVMQTSVTDVNGVAPFAFMYAAPTMQTSVNFTFDASGDTLTAHGVLPVSVRPLTTVGAATANGTSDMLQANTVVGQRIQIPGPGTVKRLGLCVRTAAASAHVKLALYTNPPPASPSFPAMLLAASAPAALVAGCNEVAIDAPITAPAGYYWVLAVSDSAFDLPYSAGTSTDLEGVGQAGGWSYANAFPATWGATFTPVANAIQDIFARVGN